MSFVEYFTLISTSHWSVRHTDRYVTLIGTLHLSVHHTDQYITLIIPNICSSSTFSPCRRRHCDPSKRWAIPNDAVSHARTLASQHHRFESPTSHIKYLLLFLKWRPTCLKFKNYSFCHRTILVLRPLACVAGLHGHLQIGKIGHRGSVSVIRRWKWSYPWHLA